MADVNDADNDEYDVYGADNYDVYYDDIDADDGDDGDGDDGDDDVIDANLCFRTVTAWNSMFNKIRSYFCPHKLYVAA